MSDVVKSSRTTAIRLALLAVAGAVLVTATIASSGDAQSPGERTIKLIEVDESMAFGDVAPRARNQRNPRFSGGDMHVFTSRLFDESGTRVGRIRAQCITVRGGRTFVQAQFQCNATAVLRDGTIATSASFAGNQDDEDVKLAVTGGTGAYEGARGSVSVRELPRERMENTIHLLP